MPRVPASFGMISTGVFVLYADEESFTFMTPTGHMFASWITFSVYQEDDGTVIQIHMLLRPNDPLYELGMRLRVIPFFEDRFWSQTLGNLQDSGFDATQSLAMVDRMVNAQAFVMHVANQTAVLGVEAKVHEAGGLYRVVVGPYPTRDDAKRTADRLRDALGLDSTIKPH